MISRMCFTSDCHLGDVFSKKSGGHGPLAYNFFFLFGKRLLNSPRANKRAQIKLQNNTEYYGLKRVSLRVDFRNDKDWVSLGAGGR